MPTTVDLDNRVVAVAVRVARFAATLSLPIDSCPYGGGDPEQVALRRVWLATYLRVRPSAGDVKPAVTATRIAATAGHPDSCETATLNSVCHCDCAGTRHSVARTGGVPSARRFGNRRRAELPATPKSAGSFDDRDANAVSGDAARASVPVSLVRDDGVPMPMREFEALEAYQGVNYAGINAVLRGVDTSPAGGLEQAQRQIENIDSALARSPLPGEIVAYRGITGPEMFGDRLNGDMAGLEWREDAYVSTTTERSVAHGFATWKDPTRSAADHAPVIMRIVVPANVHGAELSDASIESEVLLQRGLRMRVVADRGVDDGNVRHLDVEVVLGD